MGDFPTTFRDVNRVGVEFVLTDLDLALTFMDVAECSHIEETVRRNHDNARKAYDAVVYFLEKVMPDPTQREVIDAKLALLRRRLRVAGYQN